MTITYDDFAKLEIKIGTITSAVKVPEADKLIKLEVNLGEENRQIMAGIAEFFPTPEDLVGKQVPILVNLQPRKLRGYESQGMMLAADVDGKPVLLHPQQQIPDGSVVK
jgi:methionine--tRNA ligase beta chain